MAQNRKYLGMTPQQLAILGGLAALACILFTVAGCFFLQGAPNMLAARAPQQVTPVPQITWTPYIAPTATVTETPTPVAYEMLIPEGWIQFKTPLVEIWLPKEFKKQNPKKSDDPTDLMTQELEMMGVSSGASVFPAIVNIAYEPLPEGSLDAFLELEQASLSTDEARLVDSRKVTVNSVEAVRWVFEMKIEGVDVNGLMYIFQDGGTGWIVSYVAQINDFYTMLDTFEKSIKTFRVVR